jgi:hypothetical protein
MSDTYKSPHAEMIGNDNINGEYYRMDGNQVEHVTWDGNQWSSPNQGEMKLRSTLSILAKRLSHSPIDLPNSVVITHIAVSKNTVQINLRYKSQHFVISAPVEELIGCSTAEEVAIRMLEFDMESDMAEEYWNSM